MKTLVLVVAALCLIVPATAKSDEESEPSQIWEMALIDTTSPYENKPKALVRAPDSRRAFVTGYNTVQWQTDNTPCTAAGGNICGRRDAVACPSNLALHTWVVIAGKEYECMDRTASKHDGRFDVSCDKDRACPAKITGWKTVVVLGRR